MSDDENVVLDTLNLSHHVSKTTDNLQVTFAADAGVDVVELVSASLCIFLRVLLCDLLVSFAFEDAWGFGISNRSNEVKKWARNRPDETKK